MKLLNYDTRTLIYQHMRSDVQEVKEVPQSYTKTQYDILRRLIQRKKVTEEFFTFLLSSLFEIEDWKQLTYEQMYELIHILTFWNYRTEKERKDA